MSDSPSITVDEKSEPGRTEPNAELFDLGEFFIGTFCYAFINYN